ncbi:hypothetical protein M9Y10_021935 [Tritrichomonas musculus]|uniref:Uncharacterized protein n=1 Tax=Tritrichomonas musculus TaxID=1915356 RepID=A0ABR2KQT8_9EUKA
MNNSVQPSFSIDSVLANLTESTEIDCSEDGIQFSEMIQKYQNEAHTIQSILNTLYQQIDKSLTPKSQKNSHTSNISVPTAAIDEIQERLRALEKENEELSIQMKRFAAMSDISSFQINNSKQFNQSQQSYKLNSSVFSSNISHPASIDISKEYQNNDSYWESKYKELLNENKKLSKELIKQKEINEELTNQQSTLLSKLCSITHFVEKKETDKNTQIEEIIAHLSNYVDLYNSQREIVHAAFFEISNNKQKINEILNSFKNELLNIRLQTMRQIRNPKDILYSTQSDNSSEFSKRFISKSSKETIFKGNSKFSTVFTQPDLKSVPSLVIQGCEELIDSVSSHFTGITKIPINEIINNPREFTRYINLIRSHLDMNVQSLKTENKNLTQDLSLANNKIRLSTVSPEIQNTIKNVMSAINKVSKEMQNEHKELIAQLDN